MKEGGDNGGREEEMDVGVGGCLGGREGGCELEGGGGWREGKKESKSEAHRRWPGPAQAVTARDLNNPGIW